MRQPIRKGAGILSGVAAVWNFLLPLWHWFVKIVGARARLRTLKLRVLNFVHPI